MTVDDIQHDTTRKSLRGEWIHGKYHFSTAEGHHVLYGGTPKGELTEKLIREWQFKTFKELTGRDYRA